MKSVEPFVKSNSNYYNYSPSKQGQRVFLYPTHTGLFHYESGYNIKRQSYDSFLLMFIQKGELEIHSDLTQCTAHKGQVVLLNCFAPHSYSALSDTSVLWLHFDGIVAKEYFRMITTEKGIVSTLQNAILIEKNLMKIYEVFHTDAPIKEALLSNYITNILTLLILDQQENITHSSNTSAIENTVAYMNKNLAQNLTLEQLAEQASLSPYYFTRVFKKETGFTPYQYLLNSRMMHAKFLLKTTSLSIKEICFACGFSCESNFCFAFKKKEHMTPSAYRTNSETF